VTDVTARAGEVMRPGDTLLHMTWEIAGTLVLVCWRRMNMNAELHRREGERGGGAMRKFAIVVCLVGFLASDGFAQQADKQGRRNFVPPSVVTATEAVYPLQSVVSGTVVLEVSLDAAGKIADIRVVRGIASLTEPAEHSVREWIFQPANLDGKPVSSKIVVAFSFVPPNVGPRA
jgi:TonB family protein